MALGSLVLCGCPADDDGDTGAETGSQPTTSGATEGDSGTSAPPATDSGDDVLDATDAVTDDAATEPGSDSGSGSDDVLETGGPTCAALECEGECIAADDCIGPAICVVPATEDCLGCMGKSCADVGGRDAAAVDVANTLGNCYDGEGDPLAACMEESCAELCEGPFLETCMCV